MTSDYQLAARVRQSMRKYQPAERTLRGFLGMDGGTVRVPAREHYVYVRLWNGEIVQAFNRIVPATYGLAVTVIYRNRRYLISGATDVYQEPVFFAFPDGGEAALQWPGANTLYVRPEQIVAGLLHPISGSVKLRFFGCTLADSGQFYEIAPSDLDLSSYVPATGAEWVLIEATSTGIVMTATSGAATSPDLLAMSSIPAPTGFALAAVKVYASQTEFVHAKYYSDIRDLRFFGGGNGSGTIVLPSNKVIATNGAVIDTSGPDWNATDKMIIITKDAAFINPYATQPGLMAIGESTKPGALVAIAATNGTAGPTFFGARGDGSLASPTNVKTDMRTGSFGSGGYDGTNWTGTQAVMRILADENWTPTARGSHIEFWETPTGSNTLTKLFNLRDLLPASRIQNPTTTSDFLVGEQVSGVWKWVKKTLAETVTILRANLDSVYAAIGHNHSGTYEPANSNIQTHIAASAPHSGHVTLTTLAGRHLLPMAAYNAQQPVTGLAGAVPYQVTIDRNTTLKNLAISIYVDGTNDSSNYWSIYLRKLDNTDLLSTPFTTQSDSGSTWLLKTTASFAISALTSSDKGIRVVALRTGTPSPMYMSLPDMEVEF